MARNVVEMMGISPEQQTGSMGNSGDTGVEDTTPVERS